MIKISTHILDIAAGKPAKGVALSLEKEVAEGWKPVGIGATDDDGRCSSLGTADELQPGIYRLTFLVGDYFAAASQKSLYPEITVSFLVEAGQKYHIPLLLSPFGYSTYRGS